MKQLMVGTASVAVGCFILIKLAKIEVLRGPMLFAVDPALENKAVGLVAVPILAVGMLSVFVKPNVVTACVSAVSLLLWLALGLLGVGIQV